MAENDSSSSVQSSTQTKVAISPVYDVIWDMYPVPPPVVRCASDQANKESFSQERDIFYCRTLVISREFPIHAFLHLDDPSSPKSIQSESSHLIGIMMKEIFDLSNVMRLISDCFSESSSQHIFLKEFAIRDLESLQAQLRAETLRIHTVNDRLTKTWSQDHPPTLDAVHDSLSERNSEELHHSFDRSRPPSRAFSLTRSRAGSFVSVDKRRDSESSLIERLTSTVLSLFDKDGGTNLSKHPEVINPEAPCGCGLIWESSAVLKVTQNFVFLDILGIVVSSLRKYNWL
jgi:hypothetical protein